MVKSGLFVITSDHGNHLNHDFCDPVGDNEIVDDNRGQWLLAMTTRLCEGNGTTIIWMIICIALATYMHDILQTMAMAWVVMAQVLLQPASWMSWQPCTLPCCHGFIICFGVKPSPYQWLTIWRCWSNALSGSCDHGKPLLVINNSW